MQRLVAPRQPSHVAARPLAGLRVQHPETGCGGGLVEVTWNAEAQTRAGARGDKAFIKRRRPSSAPQTRTARRSWRCSARPPRLSGPLVMIKVGGRGRGEEKSHTCEGKGKGLIRLDWQDCCCIHTSPASALCPPRPVLSPHW